MNLQKYVNKAISVEAWEAKYIKTEDIVTGDWVRLKCQYGCSEYGKTLTCPPYSPTPEYTRKMLESYSTALLIVFQRKGERFYPGLRKTIAILEREAFLDGYYKAFGMASGPCDLCKKCNINDTCKHSEKARPAMEACGIDVFQTVRNAGITIETVKSYNQLCMACGILLIE
jgi:predicted metal-binding protein